MQQICAQEKNSARTRPKVILQRFCTAFFSLDT
uniref:Uncharacterized protein n=1 Tax=Anguilla anguilla TaxID=7936 RepID=A0A0E9XXL6_ANGAN